MPALTIAEARALLASTRSPERRRGAAALRKFADPASGPLLLEALAVEMKDTRTWETQYQMVMAVASCGNGEALAHLEEMATVERESLAVTSAIGHALVRLDESPLRRTFWCVDQRVAGLHGGAMQAVALLRLTPGPEPEAQLIAEARASNDFLVHLWTALAASGWSGQYVTDFLSRCSADFSQGELLSSVARSAMQGDYVEVPYL